MATPAGSDWFLSQTRGGGSFNLLPFDTLKHIVIQVYVSEHVHDTEGSARKGLTCKCLVRSALII